MQRQHSDLKPRGGPWRDRDSFGTQMFACEGVCRCAPTGSTPPIPHPQRRGPRGWAVTGWCSPSGPTRTGSCSSMTPNPTAATAPRTKAATRRALSLLHPQGSIHYILWGGGGLRPVWFLWIMPNAITEVSFCLTTLCHHPKKSFFSDEGNGTKLPYFLLPTRIPHIANCMNHYSTISRTSIFLVRRRSHSPCGGDHGLLMGFTT